MDHDTMMIQEQGDLGLGLEPVGEQANKIEKDGGDRMPKDAKDIQH